MSENYTDHLYGPLESIPAHVEYHAPQFFLSLDGKKAIPIAAIQMLEVMQWKGKWIVHVHIFRCDECVTLSRHDTEEEAKAYLAALTGPGIFRCPADASGATDA